MTLGRSLLWGTAGFTLVSVAGFAPWALAGGWFRRTVGEAGMYAACALVFIGLSGPVLYRLVQGPGALVRFYRSFGPAFALYSAAWIAAWMSLGGHAGSLVGLFAGTALMGMILAAFFGAWRALLPVIAVLFVSNTAGYYVGGWLEAALVGHNRTLAMLSWGVAYGLGFGLGLGYAFYACQAPAPAPEETNKPNQAG